MIPRPLRHACCAFLLVSAAAPLAAAPKFEAHVLDPHPGEIVYAVAPADVNGDGKPDVVAVTENAVYWYAAPDWKKHVVVENQTVRDNVCIAPHDIDGDGAVDFALGAGWPQAGGTIQWLSRGATLNEKWNVHFIAEIPSTHRMRWADVLGTGKPQLTVSPLNKSGDDPGARLTAFEIPADPKKDRWPATVMDNTLNRVHNHWHFTKTDGKSNGKVVVTVTASQEGLYTHFHDKGEKFFKIPITSTIEQRSRESDVKPTDQGAGELKGAHLNGGDLNGRVLYATIEPMHGNKVVAYISPILDSIAYRGVVLDDTLGRGHALWLADLDADGDQEIVAGHSDPAKGAIKGPGVYVYEASPNDPFRWTKHVIDDGGMATEDLFCLDLTGDGRPDIVAGGRNTHNVKLYVNKGDE